MDYKFRESGNFKIDFFYRLVSLKNMKRHLLIFICLVLFAGPLYGEDLYKEFSTQHGFSVFLTEDWIEIPKKILDSAAKNFIEKSEKIQRWDYGYQLSSSQNWFQYPYILIQVNEKRRIREVQLKNYKKSKMIEDLREAEKITGDLMSEARLGETYYDSQNHILYTTSKVKVQNFGDVIAFGATILTEKGYIQFSGFTLAENADKSTLFFNNAVERIRLNDDLVYKPKITDSIPSGVDWGPINTVIGAVLGVSILVFISYLKS